MASSVNKPLTIAMIAGEPSGDILAANLMKALKTRFPHARFEGIGGQRMCDLGFHSLFPLERLSVMGFWEPLKRLPELLSMRRHLKQHFIKTKPDVFIGIDAPDFNLDLEIALKKQGIKTVHYVSPTVWAWRPGRIKKIKKAVDLMLSLFPFEQSIYDAHQIPYCFVGHTLADQIPEHTDKASTRAKLGLQEKGRYVALLPGSRRQELNALVPSFVQTAKWCLQHDPGIQFISACPNLQREAQLKATLKAHNAPPVAVFSGQSTAVMGAADVILLASGTASLEAMLIKRPTLVAYKTSKLTFAIAKRLIKVPYIALPNLLAGRVIMPEYIQENLDPKVIGKRIMSILQNPHSLNETVTEFERLHGILKNDAGNTAATAIKTLLS